MAIKINQVLNIYDRGVLNKFDISPKDGEISENEILPAAKALADLRGISCPTEVAEAEKLLVKLLYLNLEPLALRKIEIEYPPLIAAANDNDLETVLTLLKQKADPSVKENYLGRTALMVTSNPEIAAALIKAGADVNARAENGLTTIMHAKNAEIVRLLVVAGAEVDARDEQGQTALMMSENVPYYTRFKPISNQEPFDEREWDNLEWRLRYKWLTDVHKAEALIAAGADVNAKDKMGRTALMKALDSQVVQALIKAGADVNTKDENGETALMSTDWKNNPKAFQARLKEKEKIVKLLISAGADITAKDGKGRTALDITKAIELPDEVLIKLLSTKK